MFRNYLITALRNFTRHKLYSFINIAGLTVGLTCAIFIILFVRDQLSYDRWIPGTENLYRVGHSTHVPGQPLMWTSKIPFPVTQAMLEQIPEVRARTRLIRSQVTVSVENRQFPEIVNSVDPNFFQVIQLPLIAGDPTSVFAHPDSVVLSEARARKYFGHGSALGKTITISANYCDSQGKCQSQQHALVVSGILYDLPHNTQMAADLVMPNTSQADPTDWNTKTNWLNTSGWGYVLLAPGANPNQVIAKLRAIIDRSVDPRTRMKLNMKGSEMEPPYLTPFRDDHLSTDRYGSMTPAGSWTIIYGFAAIGILILLVACFNFTNLATARATLRVREISLRKVMGAARKQLIIQFLGESLLTALIALLLALSLTETLLPAFNRFLNIPITFQYVRNWYVLGLIVTMAIAAGFLSGIYPALILSGFRPANALRANTSKSLNSGILRTTLVVLQFAVSIGLGIAALVVFAQISFARHVDLGVRKDGVLVIDANNISASGRDSFAKALRSNPDITNVSVTDSFAIPFSDNNNNTDVNVPGNPSSLTFWVISADPGYAEVYGARLLQGRLLSEQHSADKVTDIHMSGFNFSSPPYNIMVNETGARMLGYSNASAIGKTITVNGTPATIVGVTGDIKMLGASRPIRPTLYRNIPAFTGQVSVYLRSQHLSNTLGFIDRTWHAFAPSAVISRHFLSDDFEDQFQAVEKQGTMFALFVGIAIFIACLGLFGLASFAAERRTREIGFRKVFGARSRDIVWLLLWQFSIPVLIANLIAWPLAYYYLRSWLDGYAYRIGLSPAYFLASGTAALVIAWATVFAHASRVARANPIHALRYE
ncbi:MAG: ABC transporter permease [Alphaproteobacteria bacterium]|nr:ABC transporter permease [Alphaproteobacteria bacterium]